MRNSNFERKTRETEIALSINLDGLGKNTISTGIKFFDHLLEQFSFYSGFDLNLKVIGDLELDTHHTVEDIAIALGSSLNQCLADKRGITRFSDVFIPMDESLVQVIVDISGRPFYKGKILCSTSYVGNGKNLIPIDLIEHFLYSFAINAKITLHIRQLYGSNAHHICEAIFKALGRALGIATTIKQDKSSGFIPSTKGVIE